MSVVIKPGRVVALPNGPSASGNSVYRIELDIAPGDVVPVDCSSTGEMNRVESLYVDNSRGAVALFVRFSDTGRLLIVPPGAEGCYDTYSRQANFLVAQSGSGKTPLRCRLMAFSCRKTVFERFPGAWGLLEAGSDVNTNPGQYSNSIAPVVPVPFIPAPIIAGWSLDALSPAISFPNPHRVVNTGTGGPFHINWMSPRSTGKLYFEISCEFRGSNFQSGVGIISTILKYNEFNIYDNFYVPGPSVISGLGSDANGTENGTRIAIGDYDPLGTGGRGQIAGWAVDLDNKAITLLGVGGYVSKPSYAGGGNPFGSNISQMRFPICPTVIYSGNNTSGGATINTAGPFVYTPPAGYIAWDADNAAVVVTTTAPQTQGNTAPAPAPQTQGNTAPAISAKYWRILIHRSAQPTLESYGDYPSIAEIVFASVAGGASQAAGGTATASINGANAPLAFDGDATTLWGSSSSVPPDQYIQMQHVNAVSVAEVRLTARNDHFALSQSFGTWDLQYSTDGVAFTTLKSFISNTWAAGQTIAFAVAP